MCVTARRSNRNATRSLLPPLSFSYVIGEADDIAVGRSCSRHFRERRMLLGSRMSTQSRVFLAILLPPQGVCLLDHSD